MGQMQLLPAFLVLLLLSSSLCSASFCFTETVTCENWSGSEFSASDIATLQSILQDAQTAGSAWSSIEGYYGGSFTVVWEFAGDGYYLYSEWHKGASCTCTSGVYLVVQQ